MAAGADLHLVYRVDVETTTDHLGASLSLPQDLVGLEDAARDVGAALLLMDPLLSRLDTALDSHKDAEVRIALEPVVSLSERAGMSTLGLIHVNKSGLQDPLNTIMGSRAFSSAVARAVLYVMADPDDETLRLLGQPKNNLGQTDLLPTLGFRIEPAMVANTPEGEVWTGQLEWTGESTRSIRDALEAAAATAGDRTATSEAADWLHDYLTDEGGTAASSAIKAAGNKAGHSIDALKRGRKRLNIVSDSRGFPRQTYWMLPAQSGQPVGARSGETSRFALTAPTERQSVQLARSEQSGQLSRTAPTGIDGRPFRFDGRPV